MNLIKIALEKIWKYKLQKLIQNQFKSTKLRKIFSDKYSIEVGLYSYGCFSPERIVKGTTIGRYCSFGPDVSILNRNHGIKLISTHPYFFNSKLGLVSKDNLNFNHCTIEDDVWIGQGAIITPSVRCIGRGAIVGAGAIVTKDVEPYSVVAGNPAKIINFRFPPAVIAEIEKSQWWKLNIEELKDLLASNPDFLLNPEEYINRNGSLPFLIKSEASARK